MEAENSPGARRNYPNEIRQAARGMYLRRYSAGEISEALNVPRRAIHSKPVSVSAGRTSSALPPRGASWRPASAWSVHSLITLGATVRGATSLIVEPPFAAWRQRQYPVARGGEARGDAHARR